jgi:hypothetical protein
VRATVVLPRGGGGRSVEVVVLGRKVVLIIQDIQATYQRNDHYSRDQRWLINVLRLVRQHYHKEIICQ